MAALAGLLHHKAPSFQNCVIRLQPLLQQAIGDALRYLRLIIEISVFMSSSYLPNTITVLLLKLSHSLLQAMVSCKI